MAPPLRFRVRGVPVPKARARVTQRGAFTPPATVAWSQAVALAFRQAYPGHTPYPAGVALAVEVEIVAPGTGPAARIKGDGDNYLKGVQDALNAVAWHDDIQVVRATISKRRVGKHELPGAEVTIWQL